jgi:glycosyltransferase involved in cell wall biosynthesis
MVQPQASITHFEGVTGGTDISQGAKRYQDINHGKFTERWQEELRRQPHIIKNPDDQAEVRAAAEHYKKRGVLIIDAYTPEPDQDSGSVRLRNLMACFRQLGYQVTFMADNRACAGTYSSDLQAIGVEVVYEPWIKNMLDFFEQRGPGFDLIMVSRHYIAEKYIRYARHYCPDAKFIFDTVDLHYLREERLAELEDRLPLRRAAAQTKASELKLIKAADATVVVSEYEQEVLREAAPGARVQVVSNIHPVKGCRKEFAERRDLFFVGGYQHPPNIDAAIYLAKEVYPLIRAELPEVRCYLIGSKAPDSVQKLDGDGMIFKGFVQDLEPFLDGCRIALAPLRYGAGVKGKVNMSMAYGQPVVASPAAGEGLAAQHGREILIADTPEAFAAEVIRLYLETLVAGLKD